MQTKYTFEGLHKLPELFTQSDFASTFGSASPSSTWYAINKLLFNKTIEKYRVRGLYRLITAKGNLNNA